MNIPGRVFKTAVMVVPYVKFQQEEKNPNTTPSDTATVPQSSESATTEKHQAFTHDLCSSKSISDQRDAIEPQLQRVFEGSKTTEVESSASSSTTKSGLSGSDPIPEKKSAGLRVPMTPEDEREWRWIVVLLAHH